ncbi:MAG TPA: YbaB/EbfC family nucleoid-associated protein [Candidatus Acidoferrum sp.]|nr:YbaB/EbfC family nucleoid-associated protein [Candidatus Acidoferrum sp.]
MKNLGQMMKQAQAMQAKMQEMQAALERTEVTGAAGGGMVTVTVSGKGEMRRIKIDPKLVDANEVAMLEDLVVAAVNDARAKAEQQMQAEMAKLTGGLQLPPGFKLPF